MRLRKIATNRSSVLFSLLPSDNQVDDALGFAQIWQRHARGTESQASSSESSYAKSKRVDGFLYHHGRLHHKASDLHSSHVRSH